MVNLTVKELRKKDYVEEAKKSYNDKLEMIGILSLAKTQYNEYLWDNYAKDGFCIEFDEKTTFLQEEGQTLQEQANYMRSSIQTNR